MNDVPREPLRQTGWEYRGLYWKLMDQSHDTDWYVLECGELFYLGFSSKYELVDALWKMSILFYEPTEDIPDFVRIVWDWIDHEE